MHHQSPFATAEHHSCTKSAFAPVLLLQLYRLSDVGFTPTFVVYVYVYDLRVIRSIDVWKNITWLVYLYLPGPEFELTGRLVCY